MSSLIPKLLSKRSETLARHFFKVDGYNKYGLYHDDLMGGCYADHHPDVAEAYRRIAIDNPQLHDERVYRSLRASQLKIQKKILPKEEWPTYEEDMTKGRYLEPYLKQIHEEEAEKKRELASVND